MKKNFNLYFVELGLERPALIRAAEIHDFFDELCTEQIEDVFISEFIAEGDARHYESLFFFSKSFIMEAKLFLQQDSFDITPLHRLFYIEIQKTEYDFKRATEKSRLVVFVKLIEDVAAQLRASKGNCNHLKNIVMKYLRLSEVHS